MKRYTFSKQVKFRKEQDCILICDCKLLRDFKVDLELEGFIKRINCGISKSEIKGKKENLLFKDFVSMKLLSEIYLKQIPANDFKLADEFMEKHLYQGKRVRSYEFLLEKLKENPTLFIALYLDKEIIGVVQGFPRNNYLLVSEIAVDIRFKGRKFGSQLLREFEKNAKKDGHKIIKLGARDGATNFYLSNGYFPSLYIQVSIDQEETIIKKLNQDKESIKNVSHVNNITGIEIAVKDCNPQLLSQVNKEFNPISAQFLFTKNIA